MIKIRDDKEGLINKIYPGLKEKLKLAQMDTTETVFIRNCILLAAIFTLNLSIPLSLILLKEGLWFLILPCIIFFFIIILAIAVYYIPAANISRIRQDIEADIFTPSRMLLTLLESGNSLITAIESVSYTKAKSSKYFGKIASQIYLGKNVEQAIDEAIRYTPSDSFRMVLEPVKKSLKTGSDIQKTLLATLQELQEQKIVEIEQYEKRLSPISMFYMIFGIIIPAMGVVGLVVVLSIMGIEIKFFPILFIILIFLLLLQLFFVNIFKNTRPLVKL